MVRNGRPEFPPAFSRLLAVGWAVAAFSLPVSGRCADPPVAEKIPKIDIVHGDIREDDYFWLREKANPKVAAYLEAENAYAAEALAHTVALQETLYQEMLGRIRQTDLEVPYRFGDHFYYSRTEEGKQYRIFCRKAGSLEAPEEVTLDLNALAEGLDFLGLDTYEVSDDGNLLAYSTDSTGFREYELHVKDLRTGTLLPDRADRVSSVAWAADNRTLFYVTEDAAKRPYRVYRHVLGSAVDDLVYEEEDELFFVWIERTRSGGYILLHCDSQTTSDVKFLPAGKPSGAWTDLLPRRHERQCVVDHHGDRFYMLVNDTGRNFRLVSALVSDPGEQGWVEVLPHRADVMLEAIACFAGHYVVQERKDGLARFRVADLATGRVHEVAFPDPVYDAYPGDNLDWDTARFRYEYESPVTPRSVFDHDMDAGTDELLKRDEVLGGYDPGRYACERLYATAADGTRIPVSIVYRKGLVRNGRAPMLLTGYGAYGWPHSTGFSSEDVSLLDRGVISAVAHVRGGGEMGKAWHDQGRMMEKINTFTDFTAAAEFLIDGKYTSSDRLVIEGWSAGGLLMGAVTNLRPDLFKAVMSHVPFVDVINTMLDESLPLTVTEYEEWGNPNVEAEYRYIKQYCPYTNLAAKDYPALLVKTSFNDSQVMYWEPAKYVARMRALKTDRNPILLVTNMGGGHGGSSGRYDKLRERALDYAFVLWQTGLTD